MSEKLELTSLLFVGFYVTAAIDSGLASKVTFDEIYKGLEQGTLLADLSERFPDTFNFSIFPRSSERERVLIEALNESAWAMKGREARKAGVENSGLCLLMIFILEAIQHGPWRDH